MAPVTHEDLRTVEERLSGKLENERKEREHSVASIKLEVMAHVQTFQTDMLRRLAGIEESVRPLAGQVGGLNERTSMIDRTVNMLNTKMDTLIEFRSSTFGERRGKHSVKEMVGWAVGIVSTCAAIYAELHKH